MQHADLISLEWIDYYNLALRGAAIHLYTQLQTIEQTTYQWRLLPGVKLSVICWKPFMYAWVTVVDVVIAIFFAGV